MIRKKRIRKKKKEKPVKENNWMVVEDMRSRLIREANEAADKAADMYPRETRFRHKITGDTFIIRCVGIRMDNPMKFVVYLTLLKENKPRREVDIPLDKLDESYKKIK